MSVNISRRAWLKTSALTAASFAFACNTNSRSVPESSPAISPASGGLIKLDQNENPYGISKKAQKAIEEAFSIASRYPNKNTSDLRDMIAEREGVTGDYVILGAGSTEIFSLAGLLYGEGGGEILSADPSYFGFIRYAERIGAKLHLVRLNDKLEHDLNAMSRQHKNSIGMVYVCNPNNPTGTIVDNVELRSYCEDAAKRSLVYVDEAYNDLVDDARYSSMIDLVKKDHDVMVARTFSKIHGLAGMRIGYGIAKPDIIKKFRRIQTNFAPVSILSLRAAMASYQDTEYLDFCKQKNLEAIQYTCSVLDKLGYSYTPSHTNFVLYRINRDAREFVDEMLKFNVKTRPISFHDTQWNRVSMGTMEEMQTFGEALEKMS